MRQPASLLTRVAAFPGALTPSEVRAALRLSVDAVKIFPASLGGPA
jgi:2-dehydro-3-deoxyphosphogluconate aldolase / (4S)-4-hydroxy-2-oxoglutarate aldolase